MAGENNNVAAAVGVEAVDGVKTKATKKQNSPKRETAIVETAPAASRATSLKAPGTPRKTYSERERAEKLTLIGTQVAQGVDLR